MSEWRRGRGLRILLLPGKLDLRHGRDARNLRALPAHGRYFQHGGERLVQSIHPHPLSAVPLSLWRSSAGQDLREEKPPVHLPGHLLQGFPDHPPLQHLPEDDRGGRYRGDRRRAPPRGAPTLTAFRFR